MKKQKLSSKKVGRGTLSPCPITHALDIIGDKWSLLVVRDLIAGKKTYGEFQSSPEGIPTNILAERLKRLEHHSIIIKQAYQQHPVRYSYHLTEKGQALGPVLKEIIDWGLKYIPGTKALMMKS